MPVPSDLENGVQLRLVRRRAIAVAMLYVAAAAAFLLAAMPPSSVPVRPAPMWRCRKATSTTPRRPKQTG
jgi:hypothetical protein